MTPQSATKILEAAGALGDRDHLRDQLVAIIQTVVVPELTARSKDPDTTTSQLVEIAKFMADNAGLKPKTDTAPTQQERFSVKIVTGSQEQTITVTTGDSPDTPDPINVTPTVVIPMPDPTPSKPETLELPPPPDVTNDPFLAEMLGCEVKRG